MEYTLVVTSCDRHDLLKETLESFVEFADQKPARTIIVEDSAKPAPKWLDETLRAQLGGVLWIPNGRRQGQIYSIDLAYSYVETPWIFHCEDDWKFLRTGFISRSFEIMGKYGAISTCNLRGDAWCHPWTHDPRFPEFKIAAPYWIGPWGGLSWNPGLRRKGDYVRIGSSYGKHVGYALDGCKHEEFISKKYLDMGFNIAWADDKPYVEHLGDGRSRAHTKLGALPKILIAIPATRTLSYGKWESGNEEKREGVHVSGPNPRLDAVRATWWKDVGNHPNVTAKFFLGAEDFTPPAAQDEVYLVGCPDDYASLPLKTKRIAQYALDNGYDYLFKCDDDTAVYVEKLVAEILQYQPEWGGYMGGTMAMSGGPGYILNRRAMKEVANMTPSSWAEDVSVTFALSGKDFWPHLLQGHRPGFADHWFFPQGFDPARLNSKIVTMHAVGPREMRDWYAWKEGIYESSNGRTDGPGQSETPKAGAGVEGPQA